MDVRNTRQINFGSTRWIKGDDGQIQILKKGLSIPGYPSATFEVRELTTLPVPRPAGNEQILFATGNDVELLKQHGFKSGVKIPGEIYNAKEVIEALKQSAFNGKKLQFKSILRRIIGFLN